MDPVVPQDEYFEWEDIMAYQPVRENRDENKLPQSESLPSCVRKIESVGVRQVPDVPPPGSQRPAMATSTTLHSPRASLTLDTSSLGMNSTETTPTRSSPIIFPPYAEFSEDGGSFLIENCAAGTENFEIAQETMDDISLCPDPSGHVDYLSHHWSEEDIWTTWKRLQSKRRAPRVAERLENATWRAWAKVRLKLKTVSPESFNWMKDLDDTWLYGPFHGSISRTTTFNADYTNDTHSTHTAPTAKKTRSILKRPRLSEVLLRGSEHLRKFRSKSVELDSYPFYGSPAKKRVEFREDVEEYAGKHTSHHEDESKDELGHWTENYESNFLYDSNDPVEDLLSTTHSLRRHVEQNIKILENYRTRSGLSPRTKTVEKLAPASLEGPRNPESDSPIQGKATSSPTRHHGEPLRFSSLSEWTLLGGDSFFDEEEDWLEPASAPYTNWKPTIPADMDITSQIQVPTRPARPNIEVDIDDGMKDELTAVMRCEELYLEPPSLAFSEPSSSSDTNSSGSSSDELERDNMNHVIVRDLEEDESREGGRELMEMKQAFVDRVMEDFYLSEKEEGQNLSSLVPPALILVAGSHATVV